MSDESKVRPYALVNGKSGLVINTVLWDGEAAVDFGNGVAAILIQDGVMVSSGYSYKDGVFTAPAPTPEDEAETERQKLLSNTSKKQSLFNQATLKISVLQDAVDLEMATDEEAAALPVWKKYRVLLSRIDANTSAEVKWPAMPDS